MNLDKGVRKGKIICFRVYATKFLCYNHSTTKIIKSNNPLFIENFPTKGCKLYCYFGELPEYIADLKYSIDGIGLKFIKEMRHRPANFKEKQISLDDCISEIKSNSDLLGGHCWYNTIIIEKEIDLDKNGWIDNYRRIDPDKLYGCFRKFDKVFDTVSLCLLTQIDPEFFDELILSEEALIYDENKIRAFPRNMATEKEGFQYSDSGPINNNKIIRLIKKANSSSYKWLGDVAYWRIAMLSEADFWKKYYFGFICLEVLTHQAYKKILEQNKFEVKIREGRFVEEEVKIPFFDFIPKEGKCHQIPLATKFSLVAGTLNPDRYLDDVSDFMECKKMRDNMSHGNIDNMDKYKLLFEKLNNLLDFYTDKVLKLI